MHQREHEWLDYETEDTQVRFDIADMILEELAEEATTFLIAKHGNFPIMNQFTGYPGDGAGHTADDYQAPEDDGHDTDYNDY